MKKKKTEDSEQIKIKLLKYLNKISKADLR